MDNWDDLDTYVIANLCILAISEFSHLHGLVAADVQGVTQKASKNISKVQILDIYVQFRTWIDNVGALQEEEASLDRRIQHLDIFDEVFRLLKELFLTLYQCIPIRFRL